MNIWEQPVQLSNGKSFVLRKSVEPQCEDEHGESVHRFGFDAAFTDGLGHIEFMCEKTGWGLLDFAGRRSRWPAT